MSLIHSFMYAAALSTLLLLQLTAAPGCTAAVEEDSMQLQGHCPNAATDICIARLIKEELRPLQHSIANGSSLLNYADRHFVNLLWDYFRGSIKEPIAATNSELVELNLTFLHFSHIWTSSLQKVNSLMENVTHTKVNIVHSIGLLEAEKAGLQQQIDEFNISQATELFIESQELLNSSQLLLRKLIDLESVINTTVQQLSIVVARILQQTVNITPESFVDVIRNSSDDALVMAIEKMQSAKDTSRNTNDTLREIPQLMAKFERMMRVLDELNRTREEGETITTVVTKTVNDSLLVLVELHKNVEPLLDDIQTVVSNGNLSNTATSQLTQNVLLAVEESLAIMADYRVFKARLQVVEAGADRAVEHTLELIQQVQIISEIATRFLNEEYVDEFDRLELINQTVTRAKLISDEILSDVKSVGELVSSAVEIEASARLLAQNVTTLSLSILNPAVNQLYTGLVGYNLLETIYLNTMQRVLSSEDALSFVEEELVIFTRKLNLIQSSEDNGREKVKEVSSLLSEVNLENITSEITKATSDAFNSLDKSTTNFSQINTTQLSLEEHLLNLTECFQNISHTYSLLSDLLDQATSLVSATYRFIDQAEVPLEFGNNLSMALALNPDQLKSSPGISGEFRSLSFQFTPSNVSSSAIVHLFSPRRNQASTELLAEIFNTHLRVVLKTTTSRGLEFPLLLTVSESTLEPHRTYSVFISRTESNVHIRVTDLQTSEIFSVPGVASTRLIRAFSASSFLASATLHIGGTAAAMPQNTNYSGCIGSIGINGKYLNLWSLATDLGKMDLRPCSIKYIAADKHGKVQLSFNGDRFAQLGVNGSFLPLMMEFQTQLPNGLLLYTQSDTTEPVLNSLLVYLDLGRIEVRVASGDRQRTLTSSQTYNNGALHSININLEGSRLVLKTVKEVVNKGLQRVPVSSLANYSELFMGGVGPRVREEADIQQGNLTGCVSAFSLNSMLKAPKCFEQDIMECSYCSKHEAAFSADFYGTSYAAFPAFTATEYLDISFNFRTYFEDGLIMFIGSAAENMWLSLTLEDAKLHLLFQSMSNTPYDFITGVGVNDGMLHSVTVIRSGLSVSITLDDNTISLPFGFGAIVPLGEFSSDLLVGGIPKSQLNLLYFGIASDGFKGHLGSIHINGRLLDFLENIASEDVSFGRGDEVTGIQGDNQNEYYFSGSSSFAEFDIGRFVTNFSLGFQFKTESESGLLFYVFSRRREDKMAIQLNNSTIQLYIQDSATGGEWLVSLSQEVSNGEWHDVRINQHGENITLVLDNDLQEILTQPVSLRTTSPLYIGGLPSGQRIPLSDTVITEHFIGCLRTHYISLSVQHGINVSSCDGAP